MGRVNLLMAASRKRNCFHAHCYDSKPKVDPGGQAALFKLTSAEVPPMEFFNQGEKILDTAGWIVDMAILLENTEEPVSFSQEWKIKNTIKQYHLALERLASFIEK